MIALGVKGIAHIMNFATKKKQIFTKENWDTKKSDYLCGVSSFLHDCIFWLAVFTLRREMRGFFL